MIGAGERLYRVLWVRCDPHTGEATGARGVLFPGPLTHSQACTCIRKCTPNKGTRYQFEEIPDDEPAASIEPLDSYDLAYMARYSRSGAAEAEHDGDLQHADRLRGLAEKCEALADAAREAEAPGDEDDEQPIPDEDDTGAGMIGAGEGEW